MFSLFLNPSNYYFNIYAVPTIIVGVLIISIAFFVLKQNQGSLVNTAFFLQCFSVGIWVLTISFVYLSRLPELALVWYRYFTFLGVTNIMPSFSLLAIAWSGKAGQKKAFIIINYIASIIFYFLVITTDIVIDPYHVRKYFWGFYPIYKPVAGLFVFLYLMQFSVGIYMLLSAYRKERIPIRKSQVETMAMATLIGSVASFDFIPKFFYFPMYPYGYIPIFIYVSLVAYAIVRYRTFDIETAIHKTGMWLFSFSFIIIPLVLMYRLFSPYLVGSDIWQTVFWIVSFLILAFYLRLIQPRIDHFFHRRQSNAEEILNRFIDDLVHLKGLNQLIQRIEDTISETMYPQMIDVFIYNEETHAYKLASNVVKRHREIIEFSASNQFLQQLAKNDNIAYKGFVDIDPAFTPTKNAAKDYFDKTGATVVIPLVLNENLLGIINLGRKANLKRYTGPDLHFLTTLKNQATIAISNSLLYENMEEQVRERTKELVNVQKQLIQAEKLATVGTLAGGVAHEINNPLTAILTNVQMLLASDTIDDTLDRESLELIEEATKRCRTIVQKLMTYARKPLEAAEISKINLLDILKNVVSFIGYQLEQDNIKLISEVKEDAYLVMGSRNELEQVMTNLILNARDAIKQVKKGGNIYVTFSKTGDWIEIEIKDEGGGIPEGIAPKIFDPFFTTKDVGRGVGLGLSICQAIMEKHKGNIAFKSKVGEGTTFIIQLPKIEREEQDGDPKGLISHNRKLAQ